MSDVQRIAYEIAPAGKPDMHLLLSVKDRIPDLVAGYGEQKIHQLIGGLLTDYCLSLNVVRNMNEAQIAQCALAIIQEAYDDFLAIEDLVVFFEGAKLGKYGKIRDRLDAQTIFEMLEQYRQSRYNALRAIRDEQKQGGATTRTAERNVKFDEDAGTYKQLHWRDINALTEKFTKDAKNSGGDSTAD